MQNTWIAHVKKYAKKHNISYRDAMSNAKASYKHKGGAASIPDNDEDNDIEVIDPTVVGAQALTTLSASAASFTQSSSANAAGTEFIRAIETKKENKPINTTDWKTHIHDAVSKYNSNIAYDSCIISVLMAEFGGVETKKQMFSNMVTSLSAPTTATVPVAGPFELLGNIYHGNMLDKTISIAALREHLDVMNVANAKWFTDITDASYNISFIKKTTGPTTKLYVTCGTSITSEYFLEQIINLAAAKRYGIKTAKAVLKVVTDVPDNARNVIIGAAEGVGNVVGWGMNVFSTAAGIFRSEAENSELEKEKQRKAEQSSGQLRDNSAAIAAINARGKTGSTRFNKINIMSNPEQSIEITEGNITWKRAPGISKIIMDMYARERVPILTKIRSIVATNPSIEVIFGGHGFGGSLITLAALDYAISVQHTPPPKSFNSSQWSERYCKELCRNIHLYTTGSIGVGNEEYSKLVNRYISNNYCIINKNDGKVNNMGDNHPGTVIKFSQIGELLPSSVTNGINIFNKLNGINDSITKIEGSVGSTISSLNAINADIAEKLASSLQSVEAATASMRSTVDNTVGNVVEAVKGIPYLNVGIYIAQTAWALYKQAVAHSITTYMIGLSKVVVTFEMSALDDEEEGTIATYVQSRSTVGGKSKIVKRI